MARSDLPQRSFYQDALALAERFGVVTVELAFKLGWHSTRPETMLSLRQLAESGKLTTRSTQVSRDGHLLTYFVPGGQQYGRPELLRRLSVARLALDSGREFSGLIASDRLRILMAKQAPGHAPEAVSGMPFVVERDASLGTSRLWLLSVQEHRDLQRLRSSVDRWIADPELLAWRRLVKGGQAGLLLLLEHAPTAAIGELGRWYSRAPLLIEERTTCSEVPVLVAGADPLRGGRPKKTKDR